MDAATDERIDRTLNELAAEDAVELRRNEPLAAHVSMGIGGPARWMLIVHAPERIEGVVSELRRLEAPWMMLAGGSNTFFGQNGYPGVVLKLGKGFRTIEAGPGPHQVTAGAAANLSAVMNFTKRESLAGFEWAAGVPGQVGGALAGNAGTIHGDTCKNVTEVEVLDLEGRRVVRRQGEFEYGYRRSALRRDVILKATWQLAPGETDAIKARIDAGLGKRMEQPLGQRCSGCMFKNPEGDAAGRLIDAAGLKGLRVGGAEVSTKHANFFINEGEATAADLVELVKTVQARVKERFGVELELEIRMIDLDSKQ